MADEEAGDTDRIFPPFPESAVVERAIPIGPSIRQEFINHRRHVDFALMAFAEKLDAALERMAPEPAKPKPKKSTDPDIAPASAARRVAGGALAFSRYGGVVLAVLGVLQLALKARHPELAGPLGDLIQLFQ